jgi:hypothetical protein
MPSKVVLLAAALVLSLPVFADEPLKPTHKIAKPAAPNGASNTSGVSGGTANGDLIGGVTMAMQKDAKENQADQRKAAQAPRGSKRSGDKVPRTRTVNPPEK